MRGATTRDKLEKLMDAIARKSKGHGRIYLTGGACAILSGWRDATIDVDMKLAPEPPGIFDAIPALKQELDINIELAAPDDFIPPLPGWRERSLHIATCGAVEFYHYDFYSQALSKLERDHQKDMCDVEAMCSSGLIERERLLSFFDQIEPELKRYPAIEPEAFRRRVEKFAAQQ